MGTIQIDDYDREAYKTRFRVALVVVAVVFSLLIFRLARHYLQNISQFS